MAKIAFKTFALGDHKNQAIRAMRQCFQIELRRILGAVATGAPVIERKLYDRDDPEFPERLFALLREFEDMGIPYEAYLMTDAQTFAAIDTAILMRVTAMRLRTMIDDRKESIEFQQDLGAIEDADDAI